MRSQEQGSAEIAATETGHHPTDKQRQILVAIRDFEDVTGEPCSSSYLARRFKVHHSSIQKQISALHKKGWLLTPFSPITVVRAIDGL